MEPDLRLADGELLVVAADTVARARVAHLQGPGHDPATDGSASAHALLRVVLSGLTGRAPTDHLLTRRCGACGGSHGKPVLDHPELHVSLAASDRIVAVAVGRDGPVGVDVERVRSTGFAGFGGVALAPGERACTRRGRARAWTRKEAYLKATGQGLSVDPRTVDVRAPAMSGMTPAQLYDVPVPSGFACAAAVLGTARPRLTVLRRTLPS